MVSLQLWLAVLLEQPAWFGFSLLGLAAAVTLAGRHGQRILNGAVLGAALSALAFFAMRSELGARSMTPGIAALTLGAACLAFGLRAPGWSTGFLVAAILGVFGGVLARKLGYLAIGGAAPMAGIGLFLGLANHRSLSVWLPPLFCAPFVVAGAALAWLPRRPRVHDLEELERVLGITFGVLLPLLALSLERNHRSRLRLETRAQLAADQESKEAQERKRAAFRRTHGIEDDSKLPH